MSKIYYKFKSQKTNDAITFDGTSLSVFDLKREIIIAKKLGKGDFDLVIESVDDGEEYTDDSKMIPKNTCVLATRKPPSKPGKGNAQRYLTSSGPGHGPIPTPAVRVPYNRPKVTTLNNLSSTKTMGKSVDTTKDMENMTEEEKIQAMFAAEEDHWNEEQERMKAQRPVYNSSYRGRGRGRGGAHNAERPHTNSLPEDFSYQIDEPVKTPPVGYVCYRCGQKGHFISACPTLNDSEFQPKRIKRTTGIPKIFLQSVDNVESVKDKSGVMVTSNGDLVVAMANTQAWNKISSQTKNYLGTGDIQNIVTNFPPEFECRICHLLVKDAVLSNCCQTVFCDECIRNRLLEPTPPTPQFTCPACSSNLLPSKLEPAITLRKKIQDFLSGLTTSDSGSNSPGGRSPQQQQTKPKSYVVKSGTTGSGNNSPLNTYTANNGSGSGTTANGNVSISPFVPGKLLEPGQMVQIRPGVVMKVPHVVDDNGEEIVPVGGSVVGSSSGNGSTGMGGYAGTSGTGMSNYAGNGRVMMGHSGVTPPTQQHQQGMYGSGYGYQNQQMNGMGGYGNNNRFYRKRGREESDVVDLLGRR